MDDLDRRIVNALQGGFPVCERPFAVAAEGLGMDETTLIARIAALRAEGVLSRFGPLYKAEGLGGAVTLAAMAVPEDRFEEVVALVNAHPEVAHNYARDHQLNMWFVLATEDEARIAATIRAIEAETGLAVLNMPRLAEYHVGLRLEA
ncbi:Lrp/AsnC family transcriptional regulator [Siccirubricoccus sp. G192]|uniref:Lrp/AsnC family transcriptional regulator n=1 Tax=Siccirubricoccus sp. G192 TaxID=2849651 RepID=UPI001C2B8F54|nr:AsnC family transcriptional regulator [Siccirubricoccus sp. G192]MBV1797958.1 AsnC family transcriptional regulator [Siccirubricoccus sp. G192]